MDKLLKEYSQMYPILEAMDEFGGSFVKSLAELYRHADRNNQIKLIQVFEDYFLQYATMADNTAHLKLRGNKK